MFGLYTHLEDVWRKTIKFLFLGTNHFFVGRERGLIFDFSTDFKFKIAPHKQKSIVFYFLAGRWDPLANGAMYLSTSKHSGKSGTDDSADVTMYTRVYSILQ
jgi:hypothetical protein